MTTGRPIDHVVLVVDELTAAAETYEALGFTLTPRAYHDDHMGTSNRLAQFAGKSFIEILEVDRPSKLTDHDFAADPPVFSFGAQNRNFVRARTGISMLVFTCDDARADISRFRDAGIQTYAPFEFDRQATLPDGSQKTVGFTLGFATSPEMPAIAFFVCENRAPDTFWKPAFQDHANGARNIAAVYLAADDPARHGGFLGTLFGGAVTPTDGGVRVACGANQEVLVLDRAHINAIGPGAPTEIGAGPLFAGIAIEAVGAAAPVTPADQACGMFIEWRPA